MRFVQLLLLSLLLSLVTSCLVIQYPVTTTPEPHCGCPFQILTSFNIKQYLSNHSYYPTVSSQPLSEPTASGDECFQSLACPSGTELVIFDTDQYGRYTNELSAMCDSSSQQWLVDDGVHEIETFHQLYATCVRFSVCPCAGGAVDTPALWDWTQSTLFYQSNMTHHSISAGDITYTDNCISNITCPAGWSLLEIFEREGADELLKFPFICDAETKEWIYNGGTRITYPSEVFACADYATQLETTSIPQLTTSAPPCYCLEPRDLTKSEVPSDLPGTMISIDWDYQSIDRNSCYVMIIFCEADLYVMNGSVPVRVPQSSYQLDCRGESNEMGNWYVGDDQLVSSVEPRIVCMDPNGGNFISKFFSYFHY